MRDKNLLTILEQRVVVNISGLYEHDCLELIVALKVGGASVFAITVENAVDIQKAINTIMMIREQFGSEILIGVNNVTSVDMVYQFGRAGAQFIMNPNTKAEIIKATHEMGLVSIPGAMTPNEIINAYECGADIVYVYPARWLGPAYFTYACKVLKHIPTITSGGIDRSNMRLYMNAGVDVVVADDCLYSQEQLAKRQWYTISQNTQCFLNTVVRR